MAGLLTSAMTGAVGQAVKNKVLSSVGSGIASGVSSGLASGISSAIANKLTGGSSTGSSGAMDYDTYLQNGGYDKYKTQVQNSVAAQVQSAVDNYNAQIDQSRADYEDAARKTYISQMLSNKNLDQKLAANGIYGGAADSQRIAQDAAYQSNLQSLDQDYLSTVQKLKQAITDAKLSGDNTVAQAMADYLAQVQSSYASYLNQQESISKQAQEERKNYIAQLVYDRVANAFDTVTNKLLSPGTTWEAALANGSQGSKFYDYSDSGSSYSGGTTGDGTTTGSSISGSMSDGTYNGLVKTITSMVNQGATGTVSSLITQNWDKMTADQKKGISSVLSQYGKTVEDYS